MASLSNINGLFDVHSTGAILFSDEHGTTGQILKSNGDSAPTWVAASTVIGGPYLPIAGGVLEGATSTDTGISFTVGGALIVSGRATFPSAVANRPQLPGGFLGLNTGDGNFDIWGISTEYYPSHATAGNAWGLQWNGDTNQFRFVGGGSDVVTIDLDQGNFVTTGNITGTTATFSGLVSGITPTAAANFATKDYVDNNAGTTYTAGNGITLTGTPATVINADINYISYSGSNNFIVYGAQDGLGTTIPTGSIISYVPSGGTQIVTKAYVSDLPFTNNAGDITSITLGNGLTGTSLSGPIPNLTMSGSYTGDFTVTGNQYFNGEFIEGDGKEMFRYTDSWLRINEDNDFTSGIYCGTGILRTDGAFQVGSGGNKFLVTAAGAGTFVGNVTAASFTGPLTGNASTSTTFNTGRTNYKGVTDAAVIGQMMWKNYGNNHTIFDASASTSPGGTAVNNTNSNTVWTAAYPTLMGWNGSSTYGVRVDSARIADSAANQGNYLPLAGGTMSGDIIFNSNIRLEYSSTHWITPRDGSGNMHLYINSAGDGIYLDSPFTYIRQQGSEGNNVYIAGGAITSTGIIQSNASVRAPIFYDSNNTSYYVDPGATSALTTVNIKGGITFPGSGLGTIARGGSNYAIYQESGSWTSPFPDLNIGFHTGISIGAHGNYNGTRFFNNSDMVTQIMAVGNIASPLGNDNVYVNNSLLAGSSLRAPIFYDSNNTAYFGDFGGTYSNITKLKINANWGGPSGVSPDDAQFQIRGTYPSITFRSTNANKMWLRHMDSSGQIQHYYAPATDSTAWSIKHTMQIDGTFKSQGSMQAPIFYDLNDTSYYVNPATTSALKGVTIYGSSNTVGSQLKVYSTTTHNYPQIYSNGALEAMWNYKNNSAEWYVGLRTTTQLVGTAGFHFYNTTSAQTVGGWDVSGNSYSIVSSRAPIFYDSNNTGYYLNPASTSNLNALTTAGAITSTGIIQSNASVRAPIFYDSNDTNSYFEANRIVMRGTDPTVIMRDTASRSAMMHVNSGRWYLLGGAVDSSSWSQVGGAWPLYIELTNNNAYFGGIVQSTTSSRGPVFYDSANTAFYLDPNNTGTSLNVAGDVVGYSSSDIRYKDNVKPIENALDKIDKIKGYTFEWNELSHKQTGKKDIGVIAQEVEEILPEIIDTRSDGYKAVDYPKLTALLIQSVKEQQIIINDLKSRIEKLEL